jgi:hypothetical protein
VREVEMELGEMEAERQRLLRKIAGDRWEWDM